MPPATPASWEIRPATSAESADALALVFRDLEQPLAALRIRQTLADAEGKPVDGLWVARRNGRIAAAMLAAIQPGRAANLLCPRAAEGVDSSIRLRLASAALGSLQVEHVQLVQALLESERGADADLLFGLGFRHASDLLYLVSNADQFPDTEPHDGLDFSTYNESEHRRLAHLVERTYVDSLDCPDLEGVRNIEDTLSGYRATGAFDPARWILARREGRDVGCVLLADHPGQQQWELVYMGVVPAARGHGYGVAIVRYAQWKARSAGAARLLLAVDAANTPALEMYASAGFFTWERRAVFLKQL